MDFPADCLTSTNVLYGFSDVAYAVCVAVRAPSGDALQDTSNEADQQARAIARLRTAELELRKANILVSLDPKRGELFTFYRKLDLQNDGKSIFGRLGTILRANACTLSYKSTTRASELFNPENAPLYRVFVSALILSIKFIVVKEHALISLNPRTFVKPKLSEATEQDISGALDFRNYLRLYSLDFQLLKTGHVLVALEPGPLAPLTQISSLLEESNGYPSELAQAMITSVRSVWLAPSGQIARYRGGFTGKLPLVAQERNEELERPAIQGQTALEMAEQENWKSCMQTWLEQEGHDLKNPDEELWIEVEVPLNSTDDHTRTNASLQVDQSDVTLWQSVFWPAALCFSICRYEPQHAITDNAMVSANDDPVKFVEDWYKSAEMRADIIGKKNPAKFAEELQVDHNGQTEPVEIDTHVEGIVSTQRLINPDGQIATAIYPTPPDGTLSHVTPGMSSIDGIAMTPGDAIRPMPEPVRESSDHEMTHEILGAPQNTGQIGTGLYDEDLFEEMPGKSFGGSEMADEPNWDYFDQHDYDNIMEDGDHVSQMEKDGQVINDMTSDDLKMSGNENNSTEEAKIIHMELDENMTENAELIKDSDFAQYNLSPLQEADYAQEIHEKTIDNPEIMASPSLNPAEIRKLFSDWKDVGLSPTEGHSETLESLKIPHGRRQSSFDSISFEQKVNIFETRYGAEGRFWFGGTNAHHLPDRASVDTVRIPTLGLPRNETKGSKPNKVQSVSHDEMQVDFSQPRTPSSSSDSGSSSGASFWGSDEPLSPATPMKRKWADYTPMSPKADFQEIAPDVKRKIQDSSYRLLEALRPEISDRCLVNYLTALSVMPSRQPGDVASAAGDTIVFAAQLFVDQLCQSSLDHHWEGYTADCQDASYYLEISRPLEQVYGKVDSPDLRHLTTSTDAMEKADSQARIVPLDPSRVRLRRVEKLLEASSTVLPFWDVLGLQPAGGRKDITAFCIHPTGTNFEEGAENLLDRLGETYVNCNLGTHTTGKIAGVADDGLVSWSIVDSNIESSKSVLIQTCEKLGTALSQLPFSNHTVMIYIINPSRGEYFAFGICTAFVALFTAYLKACGSQKPNELALQIIPVDFVASAAMLAIPSQAEYLNLAIEVYNRCPPPQVEDEPTRCHSAVVLAEPSPREIVFDVASEVSSPLSTRDGKCMHVAYSQSLDRRWITAAWTDNLGQCAWTMSYCLRQSRSKTSRSISEVIKDIWEVTAGMMKRAHCRWRLFVARDGFLEADETNEWIVLVNQKVANDRQPLCVLNLLSFNTEPCFSLRLPPMQTKQGPANTPQQPLGTYGTPASTPQPSITSPEQITAATPTPGGTALNAPTPPDHNFDPNGEADVSLADPTEESWAVLLAQGLNNASSLLDARPALASGYLLKRKGALDADNVVVLSVNLLYTTSAPTTPGAKPSSHHQPEVLLREVLIQYRGLVTLAKTRVMIHPVRSVLPWHIATAVKGQKALSRIL